MLLFTQSEISTRFQDAVCKHCFGNLRHTNILVCLLVGARGFDLRPRSRTTQRVQNTMEATSGSSGKSGCNAGSYQHAARSLNDPLTLAAVVVLLGAVRLTAGYFPSAGLRTKNRPPR